MSRRRSTRTRKAVVMYAEAVGSEGEDGGPPQPAASSKRRRRTPSAKPAPAAPLTVTIKRGRGRPKGSKNKRRAHGSDESGDDEFFPGRRGSSTRRKKRVKAAGVDHCVVCTKALGDDEEPVLCGLCARVFHARCSVNVGFDDEWICAKCLNDDDDEATRVSSPTGEQKPGPPDAQAEELEPLLPDHVVAYLVNEVSSPRWTASDRDQAVSELHSQQDPVTGSCPLPPSGIDLNLPLEHLKEAVFVYETAHYYGSFIGLSPFLLEDFCAALLAAEHSQMLSHLHQAVLQAILYEKFDGEAYSTFMSLQMSVLGEYTWPVVLRRLAVDHPDLLTCGVPPAAQDALDSLAGTDYALLEPRHRLAILSMLTEEFLCTTLVRSVVDNGGLPYDGDVCKVCDLPGELIICERCFSGYHLDCTSLSEVPDGEWICASCVEQAVKGLTDCVSRQAKEGLVRAICLGTDHLKRRFMFMARRIFVETEGGCLYFSAPEQIDQLVCALKDSRGACAHLLARIEEWRPELTRQMTITRELFAADLASSIDQPLPPPLRPGDSPAVSPPGVSPDSMISALDPQLFAAPEPSEEDRSRRRARRWSAAEGMKAVGADQELPVFRLGDRGSFRRWRNWLPIPAFHATEDMPSRFSLETQSWPHHFQPTAGPPRLLANTLVFQKALLAIEERVCWSFYHPIWFRERLTWRQEVQSSTTREELAACTLALGDGIRAVTFCQSWKEPLHEHGCALLTAWNVFLETSNKPPVIARQVVPTGHKRKSRVPRRTTETEPALEDVPFAQGSNNWVWCRPGRRSWMGDTPRVSHRAGKLAKAHDRLFSAALDKRLRMGVSSTKCYSPTCSQDKPCFVPTCPFIRNAALISIGVIRLALPPPTEEFPPAAEEPVTPPQAQRMLPQRRNPKRASLLMPKVKGLDRHMMAIAAEFTAGIGRKRERSARRASMMAADDSPLAASPFASRSRTKIKFEELPRRPPVAASRQHYLTRLERSRGAAVFYLPDAQARALGRKAGHAQTPRFGYRGLSLQPSLQVLWEQFASGIRTTDEVAALVKMLQCAILWGSWQVSAAESIREEQGTTYVVLQRRFKGPSREYLLRTENREGGYSQSEGWVPEEEVPELVFIKKYEEQRVRRIGVMRSREKSQNVEAGTLTGDVEEYVEAISSGLAPRFVYNVWHAPKDTPPDPVNPYPEVCAMFDAMLRKAKADQERLRQAALLQQARRKHEQETRQRAEDARTRTTIQRILDQMVKTVEKREKRSKAEAREAKRREAEAHARAVALLPKKTDAERLSEALLHDLERALVEDMDGSGAKRKRKPKRRPGRPKKLAGGNGAANGTSKRRRTAEGGHEEGGHNEQEAGGEGGEEEEEEDDTEYCICRGRDDGRVMVQCEMCEDWFHIECVGLKTIPDKAYACQACTAKMQAKSRRLPPLKTLALTKSRVAQLGSLLNQLSARSCAEVFLAPVDVSIVADYLDVIRNPMDLSTVRRKVNRRQYRNVQDFADDVRLIFDNCRLYNPPESEYTALANECEALFKMLLPAIVT